MIIKTGAMGDVLRSTSILPGIKEKWQNSEIYWVTGADSFDMLKGNTFISKLFIYSDNLIKELGNIEFLMVINLEEDINAAKLATSLQGQVIGFYLKEGKVVPTKSAETWYNMSVLGPAPMNDELKRANRRTYQQHLFDIIGIDSSHKEYVFQLSDEKQIFGKKFAERNGILQGDLVVGLNTGAGKRWRLKRLDEEKTIQLAGRLLNDYGAKVILLGGPEEEKRNKRILSSVPELIDAGSNNSLLEFACIINQCGVVICSDSLALHLAIALKKKVVAFFGPTSPWEIELYGRGVRVYKDSPCLACYNKKNEIADKKCIDYVTVDMLLDGVQRVLK